MLFRACLAAALPSLLMADTAPPAVYCVPGAPAISWPSSSLSQITSVPFSQAVDSVKFTPMLPGNSVLVHVVPTSTVSPYHSALLRMGTAGTLVPISSTALDCGPRAVGVTNAASSTLMGIFTPDDDQIETILPLQLDITVVVSRVDDAFGGGTSIQYAYEKLFLEDWMLNASNQWGQTDGVDVRVTGNGGLDVEMKFAPEPAQQQQQVWVQSPPPPPPPEPQVLVQSPPPPPPPQEEFPDVVWHSPEESPKSPSLLSPSGAPPKSNLWGPVGSTWNAVGSSSTWKFVTGTSKSQTYGLASSVGAAWSGYVAFSCVWLVALL